MFDCVDCRFFFFMQKTAYELRISDWSSDVCSSDLHLVADLAALGQRIGHFAERDLDGLLVSGDGGLLRCLGILQVAAAAAEVEQRQRGAGAGAVGVASILEQARQGAAERADRARQRDRWDTRRARRPAIAATTAQHT